MPATIPRRARVNGNRAAELTRTVNETSSQLTPDDDQTLPEDRRPRLNRRLVGFSLLIPIWVLSIVPLARESMDGRGGADAVLVYLAVGAICLGIAAVIRSVYVVLMKRRFWSPWLFVLAIVVSLAGYVVQTGGEEIAPVTGASVQESRTA